ncbi:hypothetical protein QOZ80_6BG0468040 [Eleusine coracana subsp. coracana]|nr:hypothetical protein QOZ80_6BG0468040 [Eleusine coracana subsp. coracana]
MIPAAEISIDATFLGSGYFPCCLHGLSPIHITLVVILVTVITSMYRFRHQRPVYLIDYACFRPISKYRYPKATVLEHALLAPFYDVSSAQFIERILERSGLGDETNAPASVLYLLPYGSIDDARDEVEIVLFSAVDDLLSKTRINTDAVDILIANCGAFSPTPAIADMIINKYKLRNDIRVINLSGMGCGAGLISLGLARDLLQRMRWGSKALVVSTETTTPNFYVGKKRSMLLTNILFRMGGFAALVSTSRTKARFRLMKVVRILTSAQDMSYRCVYQEDDDEGHRGVNLSKDLTSVAGDTPRLNIITTGRHFLPTIYKFKYLFSITLTKMFNAKISSYTPNFCMAFEHFCIHAGGSAVIDSVQKGLNLSNKLAEPSRMTLHRFGNQSAASVWYELAYIEAKGQMQQGDKVFMIGFGARYECTTAVWLCVEPSLSGTDGPWAECIHRYPVDVARAASKPNSNS